VICSERQSKKKAELVKDKVTLDLQQEIFEEKVEAERNPLDM
jgi:hypothetical protein